MTEQSIVHSTDDDQIESSVRRFSPGDALAIPLPGGGYTVAVIGQLTLERMFCTTFTPCLDVFPDNAALTVWRPDGWSSWVADTLGLRDGSWMKIEEPVGLADVRDVDVHTLPRFKFVTKSGEHCLAEYDPETLFVRQTITSPDPEEYRRSPSLLPQDATTFEVAVSQNAGSPCELPDKSTVELINNERAVVAMLRERISEGATSLVFDHVLVFKRKADAQRAREELVETGYDVSEPVKIGWFGSTTVEVHLACAPDYPSVREDIRKMRQLATRLRATYDGFGATAL